MSRGGRGGFGRFGAKQGPEIIELDSGFRRNKIEQTNFYVSAEDKNTDHLDKALANEYQSLMRMFRDSPSYLRPPPPPKDIERYSDKYIKEKDVDQTDFLTHLPTSLDFFPQELHSIVDKKRIRKVIPRKNERDYLSLLKGINDGDESDDEKEEVEEEPEEDEYIDEDELDGDYADNYFDNGEMDEDDDAGDENFF